MHYSRIEAATVPSLFDVHNNFGGYGKYSGCHDERPRQAVDAEIFAYAEWLAFQGGQMTRKERAIVRRDHVRGQRGASVCKGVTFGESFYNQEKRCYEYEPGSYSIPFPGRNAHRDKVIFETLDDDGNVIASSCLPVEPKKGGVVWDRDAVRKAAGKVAKPSRGKPATPLSVEIDDRAENLATETQEPVAVADDAHEAVALLSGPEIAPVEHVSNRDELPAPGLADQVAALAAMVEEMRGQLAALSTGKPEVTTPIEGMTSAPPVSGKRERTAAHERMIRRAWAERQTRREAQREVLALRASVEYQDRRFEARTRHLTAQLEAKHTNMEKWAAEARRGRKAATKRRRAVILARDLQKRLSAEHRLVDRLTAAKREVVQDLIDARAEIATLKAKPHHMGQAVRLDDYQRLMRERDEAQASLASDREKLRQMRAALDRSADGLDMMTERALRAENALRAVEQRQDRAGAPYRVNIGAVSFRAAA